MEYILIREYEVKVVCRCPMGSKIPNVNFYQEAGF